MLRLMINRNCGAGPYYEVARSGNLDELLAQAEVYSAQQVRWSIEDENGKLVDVSPIHKNIIKTMAKIRAQEKS